MNFILVGVNVCGWLIDCVLNVLCMRYGCCCEMKVEVILVYDDFIY